MTEAGKKTQLKGVEETQVVAGEMEEEGWDHIKTWNEGIRKGQKTHTHTKKTNRSQRHEKK